VVTWRALNDADVAALGETVIAVTRELAGSMPAPKGAPYYGLDFGLTDLATLDEFSQPGIFRKYERTVALGGGLGGVQRWWATRLGCNVLGVDDRPSVSAVAARLSRRAGVDDQTGFVCGAAMRLPLASSRFTHVWDLEMLTGAPDTQAALAEALRVLRPGGALAMHLPPDRELEPSRWMDHLRAAGFVALASRTLARARAPQLLQFARRRLLARLGDRPAMLAAVAAAIEPVDAAGGGTLLFAQRPS